MAPSDDSSIRNLGTVYEDPGEGLLFMKRRRIGTADRNGDPLDGIVNLFDVAIVLAVGFLLAALTGLGMTDVLTSKNMTIVTNPGTPQMQVIVKEGNQVKQLDLKSGAQVAGLGTLLGSFYQLADGTVVYVPAGGLPPSGSTPLPGTSPTPYPSTTPYPGTTTTPGAAPYSGTTPYPTPSATLTLTPAP